MTDCWSLSNSTKQQKFWMTFLGKNYLNQHYITDLIEKRWRIYGFISCLFPTYFLSVSAIIEYFHYGFLFNGTDALIFGRDVEVFWWKGVNNINCSESCCLPSQCDFNYQNNFTEDFYLINQTSPVDGIIYNLGKTHFLFMLKDYRVLFVDPLNVSRKSFYQSWKSASLNCEKLGGHLPVFISRKSIEEFVFLLKSGGIPFMEAIFIGLKVNKETQVSCRHWNE